MLAILGYTNAALQDTELYRIAVLFYLGKLAPYPQTLR